MNASAWSAWLHNLSLWLCLLSGGVGALWALSEIIGEFRTETPRALCTWGAWMLILVNFLAAAVIFLLVIQLAPDAKSWPIALLVGLSWPTVFRNLSLKFMQPLDEAKDREAPAIRLEQIYSNIQKLALQLINSRLTRQRMRLLARATRFELDDLEKYARQMSAISPQQIDPNFIDQLMKRDDMDTDYKKALLVALVMNTFTRDALDDFLRENKNKELRS
ncbi:MAG: hypothetical protein JNJ50_16610 [Acidobacteria bacterium]|nr:hypothetical protein [Acidobacteriota bacterium]